MMANNYRSLIAPMAGLAALVIAAPALADALVVRSTGPSAATYRVGTRLPDNGRVVLRAGDRVVLVAGGATRTLNGPGNFPVRAGAVRSQGSASTLNRYLSTRGGTISRTGATRNDGVEAPRAPNAWVLDVQRGGTLCVADPASLNVWRPDYSRDALVTIESLTTPGLRANLVFATEQALRLWPIETLPVTEGARYRLSGGGMTAPIEVQFTLSGPVPGDAAAAANLFADRGCIPQLEQLGERMAEEAAGAM